MKTKKRSTAALGVVAVMLLGAGAPPAIAAEQVFSSWFAPGLACPFPLEIAGFGEEPRIKTFKGRDGQVRTISAGTGYALIFTNTDTGATVSTRSNGYAQHTRYNRDGSQTVTLTGHNVVILFPSDVPAGPSTTVHSGRVTMTISADFVSTVNRVSGRQLDICAALDG